MRVCVIGLLTVEFWATSASAAADTPGRSVDSRKSESDWARVDEAEPAGSGYGWKIMLSDVSSVALLVAGDAIAANPSQGIGTAMMVVGGAGYLVLPSVIRGAEHAPEWTIIPSIGLRVALPALGALVIGSTVSLGGSGDCELQIGAGVGLCVGAGVGMLLDWAIFGWRRSELPQESARPSTMWVAPMSQSGHWALALGGSW